jgi:ferredoxin
MCEFCTQHGEGKKWYLAMGNYSRELLADKSRAKFLEEAITNSEKKFGKRLALMDKIRDKTPFVYRFIRRMAIRQQKIDHFGQVVPIEDLEQIVDMADSIVRLPCICRYLTTGREARYCFGFGHHSDSFLYGYPDFSNSLEVMEKAEVKNLIRSFDRQGLVHSVWTFKTPYIGGICNCDQDCGAYRTQVKSNLLQVMFRAEYVGSVDWTLCNGCKSCQKQCQFGAILYSYSTKRASIDMMKCYGCGVCRAVCEPGAIILKPRSNYPGLPW